MLTTDILQLNKTEMFAKIRAGLPKLQQETQNLLECKDDLLFAWDAAEYCLLAINWRAAHLKGIQEVKYQSLVPSNLQNFQIERIVVSNEGTLIALAGARGVSILELPRRWGPNGQFMEGRERITCRSANLDAHFFNNNPHLEVRQIRWHPASPTDSHLLVLLSDNTIRVYDNYILRHVWRVGPMPSTPDSNPNSSIILALGETVVDFDIAPEIEVENASLHNNAKVMEDIKNSPFNQSINNLTKELNDNLSLTSKKRSIKCEKVEWPIILLRENGNIYMLMTSFDTDKARLQGPLTITPQTADNYGLDSCALLVIPSLPPTVVIAESNGKLHHALLLEAEEAENSFTDIDASLFIHPTEWTIHVLETVELELGLPKQETIMQRFNCPIHLKRDFINELRYFAYHDAGLHVVTVNFIAELQRFFESKVVADITALSTPSRAEYLLCTKIDTGERVNAVLGFVLHQMPSGVILLLGSGQVISLKLVIDPQLLMETNKISTAADERDSNDNNTQLAQLQAPSFVDHIKNLIKRNVTQPILSLDKSVKLTPHECHELLSQAIEVLRGQYIKKHEQVSAEIAKRVHTIRLQKEQQLQDIEYLEAQREKIREQAHKLAERFEEISDQQEILTRKCQDVMRQAKTRLPNNSVAEREFAQEVERVNKQTKNMQNLLNKSREAINRQSYHISKGNSVEKNKKFELPEKQERTIKEILLQMAAEIDGQIKEIKRINKVIGS